MKKIILTGAILGLSLLNQAAFSAAITSVTVTIAKQLFDQTGVALEGGAIGAGNNGDGAILQIGYFTNATSADLFAGQWVPLTGANSLNPVFNTTVGDGINSGAPNRASFSIAFDTSDPLRSQGLPQAGKLLSVRIFDRTTFSAARFFETVSSPDWGWLAPSEPPTNPNVSLSFANANARLQSTGAALGATVSTQVPIIVPEPSSVALLMIGAVSFVSRRRRTDKM